MNHIFNTLFDLDQKIRIYLRFLIETFGILFIYLLSIFSIGSLTEISSTLHIINVIIWVLLYFTLDLHKDQLRFSSLKSYIPIIKLSIILSFVFAIETIIYFGQLDALSSIFIFLAVSNVLVGLRVIARQLIRHNFSKTKENILVFGISDIAIDLMNAMAFGKKYNVVGFIADTPQKVDSLAGLPVIKFVDIEAYAEEKDCKLVVLASESEQFSSQQNILQKLDKLGLSVGYAPTMDRAFDYEVRLKAVNPEDVLGRSGSIEFDESLQAEIHQKTILVTGAGGSIGSELCRQILSYHPKKLVVIELSEFNLYNLEQSLIALLSQQNLSTEIIYLLGSVTSEATLERAFNTHRPEIVYHTSAYKHVPIIEENITVGIINNVIGTKLVADFSNRFGVNKFVLVSTDKAVRPTNVMGASKRLAELVIQDLAKSSQTIFTMVRFGNVLGSSGSVIPKFKSQINAGGPITVTHQEITRYFMSIPEAANLVLSAGTFASGGEVFLLNMGDPVEIVELAKSMIRQHGMQPVLSDELKKREKRDNEILIEFSGLRPGEKLYEELLVDGFAAPTPNPKIFKSEDSAIESSELGSALQLLQEKAEHDDHKAIVKLLKQLPLNYQPTTGIELVKLHEKAVKSEKKTALALRKKHQKIEKSLSDNNRPKIFQRLVWSKIVLGILHRFFFITRGMTLGVRVLIQNQNGEILLVKHSYIPGWHLPGGGVDHGETIERAAVREVYEETGIYELMDLDFCAFEYNNIISHRDHVVYFSASTNAEIKYSQNVEIADVRFVSVGDFCEMISPEYLKILEKPGFAKLLSNGHKTKNI